MPFLAEIKNFFSVCWCKLAVRWHSVQEWWRTPASLSPPPLFCLFTVRPLTPAALLSHPDSAPPLQPSTRLHSPSSLRVLKCPRLPPCPTSCQSYKTGPLLSNLTTQPPRLKSASLWISLAFRWLVFLFFSKTWPPKIQADLQTDNFRKERMKEGNPEPRARTPGTVEAFSLLEEFIQAPLLRLLSEGLSPAVTQRGDCGLRGWLWDSPSPGWRALHGVRQPRSSPLCSALHSRTINFQREEPLYSSTLHLSPSACWLVGLSICNQLLQPPPWRWGRVVLGPRSSSLPQ